MYGITIEEDGTIKKDEEGYEYDYERGIYYGIRNGKIEYNEEKPKKSTFSFEQYSINRYEEDDYEQKSFFYRGTCYPQRGTFEGTWGTKVDEDLGAVSF